MHRLSPETLPKLSRIQSIKNKKLKPGAYWTREDGTLEASNKDAIDIRTAYKLNFPRGLSLEGVGEGDQDPPLVKFHIFWSIPLCMLENLLTPEYIAAGLAEFYGRRMPLYHSHVLWTCVPRVRLVDHNKFEFSLIHFGPHLSYNRDMDADATRDLNHPAGLDAPAMHSATFHVFDFKGHDNAYARVERPAPEETITFDRGFTLDELKKRGDDELIVVGPDIIVPRSYFDLSKIIDIDTKPPTVSDESARIVASILRGESPAGADWAITVAEGDRSHGDVPPRTFHVHKSALARVSDQFEKAIRTGRCLRNDEIRVMAGENRCIMATLTAEEMQVVIPLIYGLPVPLPESGVPTLVKSLLALFKSDLLKASQSPHWERAICQKPLALDTSDARSFPSIFRLLSIIWSFPRGWMPVAKRVAIGVMADIVHLNADHDRAAVDKFIDGQVLDLIVSGEHTTHWPLIRESMFKHLHMVSSVYKTGVVGMRTMAEVEKEGEMTSSSKNQKDDVSDEEWHDEVVDGAFNPADVKCKCAIS